jgi:hypothetical protein
VHIKGSHEAVITGDQWQAYRRRREDSASTVPRSRDAAYTVSGLVRCGHCGSAMVVSGKARSPGIRFVCSAHRHYGNCPGRPAVPLAVLTDAVKAEIGKIAEDIDAATAAAESRSAKAGDARRLAEQLGKDLASADRKLTRLALRRAEDEDGILPDSAWEDAAARLKRDRARIEAELAAAARESAAASVDPLPVITGIMRGWDTYPPARLNQLLRLLIRRVVVWRTGEPERDALGHWMPQKVRVRVMPVWEPDGREPDGTHPLRFSTVGDRDSS